MYRIFLLGIDISIIKGSVGPIFYLGPETIMPLASILAAIVGFILIFWRVILKSIRKLFGKNETPVQITEYVEPDDDEDGKAGDA